MKKILSTLSFLFVFNANSNGTELEVSKCTKTENEYKYYTLNKEKNCRDIRKFCEFKGEFYSLGKGPKNEGIQCMVPFNTLYDDTAKWVSSK